MKFNIEYQTYETGLSLNLNKTIRKWKEKKNNISTYLRLEKILVG